GCGLASWPARAISFILETAVERIRVCDCWVGWLGATTRQGIPGKEEQRRQTARQSCNRMRSGAHLKSECSKCGDLDICITADGKEAVNCRF
ncbi:MAG: hypothetical protein M3Q00_06040, partial [Pseudomonadota bacterium]|nr:hypothetical protein [Pseudomonadota bacterium]